MTTDERVFYDRAEAARHEAMLQVSEVLIEKLDRDNTNAMTDIEAAVMALAHPGVINHLRALAPKAPRGPKKA